MSYGLESKCVNCEKADKCIDLQIVTGAVFTIHSIGNLKGHLGGGVISLNCGGFKAKKEEVK